MMSEEVKELKEAIGDLEKNIFKMQAHVESELGNTSRILGDLSKQITKIEHRVFGNGSEGLIIKVDRLEQAEKRSEHWKKVAGGAVLVIIIDILAKAITFFGDKAQ